MCFQGLSKNDSYLQKQEDTREPWQWENNEIWLNALKTELNFKLETKKYFINFP